MQRDYKMYAFTSLASLALSLFIVPVGVMAWVCVLSARPVLSNSELTSPIVLE